MSKPEKLAMPKREDFEDEDEFHDALLAYWREKTIFTEDEFAAYCELFPDERTLTAEDFTLSDGKEISVVVTYFDDGQEPDAKNTTILIVEKEGGTS